MLAYVRFAKEYYRDSEGRPTREIETMRFAFRPLKELYGATPATRFGPLALKTVRQRLIDFGLARSAVNQRIRYVKRMFKWACGEELLPPSVHHGLRAYFVTLTVPQTNNVATGAQAVRACLRRLHHIARVGGPGAPPRRGLGGGSPIRRSGRRRETPVPVERARPCAVAVPNAAGGFGDSRLWRASSGSGWNVDVRELDAYRKGRITDVNAAVREDCFRTLAYALKWRSVPPEARWHLHKSLNGARPGTLLRSVELRPAPGAKNGAQSRPRVGRAGGQASFRVGWWPLCRTQTVWPRREIQV
jgi:hypothetical protein